ncbi:MAG TPA: ATP-binding protein [Geobacteraceae bacterium]|nr:ATP-binding protein [Geobacteraceae bacterium]
MRDENKTKKHLINELREVRERNRELEDLVKESSRTLENRVMAEIAEKVELDHLLIEQSRLAATGELMGYFAHQWRQPLTVISLLVQDIAECYTYGSFSKGYLDSAIGKIVQVIRQMSLTMDNCRDFFKPEKIATHFFVDEIVEKTLDFLDASLKHHNIAVEVDMEAGLAVRGQPNEFSQVLLNIIGKAKDVFLEKETTSPKISIKGCRESNRTVVTIADNSGGIPDAVIERIFNPVFNGADFVNGKEIGLYTSKIIVKNIFMGNLSARNTGHGAEFRIEV